MASFVVILPSGEQNLVASEKQTLRIGRMPDNEIPIDEPSVSRRHAIITLVDGSSILTDQGSRNGTTVNGMRISGSSVLSSGDIIGVGPVRIIYEPVMNRDACSGEEDVALATLCVQSPPRQTAAPLELLETVAGIARQIGGDSSLEELLDTVLALCVEKTGAERASIMLVNDAGDLVPCAYVSTTPSPAPFAISMTIARKTMAENKAQLIRDMAGDTNLDMSESIIGLKIRSAICTPLCTREKTLGVLSLDTTRPDRQFGEVDLLFFSTLSGMIAEKIENARLSEIAKEKRRLDAELVTASDIQAHLFPAALPVIKGYDISAIYRPCREMGGDYFDVFAVGDTLVIAIADVVGKGIGPALLMSNLQAMVRSLAQELTDPSLLLARMNADLISRVGDGRFITCFLMTLNTRDDRIRYANAGHNQPLHYRHTGEILPLEVSGIPLGILADSRYELFWTGLESGDVLLLYSDGITECRGKTDELFGEERLKSVLVRAAEADASGIRSAVCSAVDTFRQDEPFADDMTLVVVKKRYG